MFGQILLDFLITLFIVFVVSNLMLKTACVRVQKKYGIEIRPKFNGSYDIDKKYIKSLIEKEREAEYIPDLKRILLIRKVNGISLLLFGGGIITIFLLFLILS